MVELLHLPLSPWSEKARWALELSGVPYRERIYQPLLGEPMLRVLLRRVRGPVSVPVLTDGSRVLADSFEIARYAAERGTLPRLFPPGHEAAVARYNELSERGLAAGRALMLPRMLADEDTLREQVPPAMRVLGPVALAIARAGVERTQRKYGANQADLDDHERVLCDVLDTLRSDLSLLARGSARADAQASGEPRTLLGELSYADLAMAQVLAFVSPPERGLVLGQASRRTYRHPTLAPRYADLLAWRDQLYARYRDAP